VSARAATWVLSGLVGLVGLACDRAPDRVEILRASDAGTAKATPAPCVPAKAEKIGVPFIRVCPEPGSDAASFWISAIPLGCSAGEHGTLSCPPVTSLLQAPPEMPDFRAPSPKLAAVVDAYTAHKVCTMRFAGRLPTRTERARARAALGLASVVVTENGAGTFRLHEVAEWVTARPCDHPTDLGPECHEGRFPVESIGPVGFPTLARCAATPVRASAFPSLELGGECAVGHVLPGASVALPCSVRGVAYGTSGAPSSPYPGFELSCERLTGDAAHGPPRLDTAAFRCVLPEWV
jgi:hypothetical protein